MTAILARGRVAVIAVVDARESDAWVWWVNASMDPDARGDRLCGAWSLSKNDREFSNTLHSLVAERMVVATTDGKALLNEAAITNCRWIDINASLASIQAMRDECQEMFEREQSERKKSNKLRDLRWPELPQPIDLENPPPAPGQANGVEIRRALAIATWVASLANTFEQIESARLDRALFREVSSLRDFPAVPS